jgi:hypothetical protein
MAQNYVVGSPVLLSGAFYNVSGTFVDPTTVTVKIRLSGGAVDTYVYVTDPEVVKTSTGCYYILYTPAFAGQYYFQWSGTGTLEALNESGFTVTASNF